jgi:hypothetical protein
MKIIAIDPGTSGGFAIYDSLEITARTQAMPATETDIVDVLHRENVGAVRVVMEKVGGYVGGKGAPGSAMFNFGRNCGVLIGAIVALRIPLEFVTPQTWQKALSLGTAKTSGTRSQWKNKLKAEAQRRWPLCQVNLKTADALLILSWTLRNP